MEGEGNELQSLFTRMGSAEREVDAINSTVDNVVQEIKRLSLKIDNQSLADGMY